MPSVAAESGVEEGEFSICYRWILNLHSFKYTVFISYLYPYFYVEGDGTDFILEGQSHIIDQFAESNSQNQQQRQPYIEGVVDLEVVSELVSGITDDEFVGLLHHDVHNPNAHHLDDGKEKNAGEDLPLLQSSLNIPARGRNTKCISLPADAFVHTLVEVHQHNDVEVSTIGGSGVVDVASRHSFLPSSLLPSNIHGGHHNIDTGATVSREAFLFSVPKQSEPSVVSGSHYSKSTMQSTDGETFVLALPETNKSKEDASYTNTNHAREGVIGSLRHSATNVVDTIANEIEHVFDPLPTDVQNVDLRVSIVPVSSTKEKGVQQEEVHLDVVIDRKVPLIGYVILILGLLALSSIGAALDLQRGVTPEMKIFWRLTSTSILFLCIGMKTKIIKREEFAKFTWQQWFELLFASANYAAMNTTFAVSLEMTSLVNAFILSNMASLLMIGGKFVVGIRVFFFEGLGALIGVAGALICATAGNTSDYDTSSGDHRMLQGISSREVTGDVLAFSASISVAIYLVVAKRLRPCIDLVLFMFLIFSLASVMLLIYIIVCSGQDYEFSFDSKVGLAGWVHPLQADRLPLELYIAIVCNGIGTMGYIAIMKYFDPVVVSMVMLMEPIVATFIGMAVGVSTLPGLVTWIGNAVVVLGSIMVIYTGSKKTETIDATDALQQFEDDKLETSDITTKSPRLLKGSLMKSPRLMRTPLVVNKLRDVEEMEFVSVGKKSKIPSTREKNGRVIWTPMNQTRKSLR